MPPVIYPLIKKANIAHSPLGWPKAIDLDEYARRQGQACIYMYDILDRLRAAEPRLASTLDELREVHQSQEEAVRQHTQFDPTLRSSFYFDSLYRDVLGIEGIQNLPEVPAQRVALFLIHIIGYLRGWDRYMLLRAYPPEDLWTYLFPQAWQNASILADDVARVYGTEPMLMAWPVVVDRETNLMRSIWKREGLSLR